MANYTEIIEGRASENGGVFLDISHKSKDFIIEKLPRMYRQFLDTLMIDISKSPMEVAPTAHYSMGGIKVNPDNHSTGIQGLYAAGEVTGGLHGANRLGGNSLAEILVFGKRAGAHAADRSINLDMQYRSKKAIDNAHDKINSFIKNGKNVVRPLQRELRNIMWEHCGVVRAEDRLNIGINKIDNLKSLLPTVDVRPDSEGFEDLMIAFDLEASIMSAESTILSALERKESRGAHQRSDFENLEESQNINYLLKLDNDNLKVERRSLELLSDELKNAINDTKDIKNFSGKLIE